MKQKNLINRVLGFSLISFLMHASQVTAAPLNLEFETGGPDISVTDITFTYNAAAELLTATGTAQQYDSDTTDTSDFILIVNGSFSLSAIIDQNGNLSDLSPGGFTITGDIGDGDVSLLEGSFTDFGFAENDAEVLEFVFDVDDGSVSNVFGTTGGLVIGQSGLPDSTTPFSADWNNEFLSGFGGFGTADAKSVVPEPAEYSLIFGILSFLTFFVTRKINRK